MGLIDQMMANLYKPPKQEKPNTILPRNLTPAKAASLAKQTMVSQGQFLKGEVLDLRANQILVLLENGATVSARTEGTLNLSIGEVSRFFVAQTTEEQILLKLAKEENDQAENPMIDKALTAAGITKTERSVSIVAELLAHQQPVNEAGIRHYLSLSAKHPELPVKDLILMELHHIPVTKENIAQFTAYQDRTAKLLTQADNMLNGFIKTVQQLPEGTAKQEILQELQQILGKTPAASESTAGPADSAASLGQTVPPAKGPATEPAAVPPQLPEAAVQQPAAEVPGNSAALPNQPADTPSLASPGPVLTSPAADTTATPDATHLVADTALHSEEESFVNRFLDSFLLHPEDIADPEKVQNYYEELNERLSKLEQLSQKLAETTTEKNSADSPKQMRQNLSFMEAVNNVFPYIQLPLKFREAPTHGELYVYEKKKALKPSDTLSALLHLEMEALGTTDIFVTLAGNHVTTRFSMTSKDSKDLIVTELPKLSAALSAKGYTLQSEVTVREPEEEKTAPTLLEQFLEEHAPGSLNRYTFDIRA